MRMELLLTSHVLRPSSGVFESIVAGACACQACLHAHGGLAMLSRAMILPPVSVI